MPALDLIKEKLLSSICWSVVGGAGAGTAILLQFGGKIPRAKPLMNRALSGEERLFDGEFTLFVECAWRLQTRDGVLCTSLSSNLEGEPRQLALRQLVGQRAVAVEVRYPAGDLEVSFGNGLALSAFADQANEADQVDNYTFRFPDGVIKNGCRSAISVLPGE